MKLSVKNWVFFIFFHISSFFLLITNQLSGLQKRLAVYIRPLKPQHSFIVALGLLPWASDYLSSLSGLWGNIMLDVYVHSVFTTTVTDLTLSNNCYLAIVPLVVV